MSDMFQSGTDRLIHDFFRSTGLSPEPAIGFTSHGTVLQNGAARRFTPSDLTAIQIASEEADARGRARVAVSLGEAELSVHRYGGSGNRLVRVRALTPMRAGEDHGNAPGGAAAPALCGITPEWAGAIRAVEQARATSRPLIIAGEPGSGKTSLAAGAAFGAGQPIPGVAVIDAGSFEVIGARRWFERVRGALNEQRSLVMSNVDVLDQRQLAGLRAMLRAMPQLQRITLTVSVSGPHEAEPFALMFGAHLVRIPALRERPGDIGELWRGFAQRERPGAAVLPDAEALATLKRYRWPGNLRELQTTVAHALSRRIRGLVAVEELPAQIRTSHAQGLMVKVEQEAIHRALLATGGNRTRAAEILGISRATIYRKAKSLGIPA